MGVRGWVVVGFFAALTLAGLGYYWRTRVSTAATVRIETTRARESNATTERTTRTLQRIHTDDGAREANDLIKGAQDPWPPR